MRLPNKQNKQAKSRKEKIKENHQACNFIKKRT